MNEVRILAPAGMLGYGIPEKSFQAGLAMKPHAIVIDAGSTDAGPHKLGAGVGIVSKIAAKKDFDMMLTAGLAHKIPVIVGSAGGSGGKPHINWTLEVVKELAAERGWKLRVAVINATADKEWLKDQLQKGRISPMTGAPELTLEDIEQSTEIVAQMGHEPYLEALAQGVDLIIAGRSYDPSMTVAACIHNGNHNLGLAYHMGKIIECGCLCTIPGGPDAIMGILYGDSFVIQSLNPERRCTPLSVAAHTLYEKEHPYHLAGPGGVLDLERCTFEQLENNAVRVRGSQFVPDQVYKVKLEGAKLAGYRSIFIGALRDPLAVAAVDEIIGAGTYMARCMMKQLELDDHQVFMDFKVYGRDGVMAEREPVKQAAPHELCVVAEFVAPTQEQAAAICAKARAGMMHFHYTGRKATAGNLALPFAPSDFSVGPAYQFSVYHLVEVDSPLAFFTTTYQTIGEEE
ncbi:acyclic terpene utilization AtuA family protein [Hominifimenecus sp. rT4P-3]|uniref:acyclic terpene utilization AtuA family protein n=1 Tax=Hominifimenecus sp. rT4P-3 TaxID=3242979 RepID=UPI003DA4E1B0